MLGLLLPAAPITAETTVALDYSSLATYYVDVGIPGAGVDAYLLDTGAGFMTITEGTLAAARKAGGARYVRDIQGVMADGSDLRVPVYLVKQMTIGSHCRLTEVEVAVIPGASRGLLGLSALRKAAPFSLDFEPPTMSLTRCGD